MREIVGCEEIFEMRKIFLTLLKLQIQTRTVGRIDATAQQKLDIITGIYATHCAKYKM